MDDTREILVRQTAFLGALVTTLLGETRPGCKEELPFIECAVKPLASAMGI